jgi:hypothetical protein
MGRIRGAIDAGGVAAGEGASTAVLHRAARHARSRRVADRSCAAGGVALASGRRRPRVLPDAPIGTVRVAAIGGRCNALGRLGVAGGPGWADSAHVGLQRRINEAARTTQHAPADQGEGSDREHSWGQLHEENIPDAAPQYNSDVVPMPCLDRGLLSASARSAADRISSLNRWRSRALATTTGWGARERQRTSLPEKR